MIKYLVKINGKAPNTNPNFAGKEFEAFYGKDQKQLSYTGSMAEYTYSVSKLWKSDIMEYGYNRECDAKRSWIYKNPTNDQYWNETVSIIAMEV